MWSTLTAKRPALVKVSRLAELRDSENSTSGGSSETEVKLLAVSPIGAPSASSVVMMVTPVVKQPRASRRMRGSEPLM